MITKDNFKDVLFSLGFEEVESGVWVKNYHNNSQTFQMKANFNRERLEYAQGITIGRDTTSNFSEPENFVVFECVDRLLTKGYKPEHIELEPAWKLGHTQKGGYADIWVRTYNALSSEMASEKESLLIIECKKSDEFNGAWKDTLEDGAQLFSYFQQEQSTKFLCLYTSDFDGNEVKPDYYLINVQDNENLLQNTADAKSYKSASNNKQLFHVWHDTYMCEAPKRGLFEKDIQAYNIGKNKFTVKDLMPVSNEEIKKKYNEFATILRQHNVGAKENAFDKLVNLFLAKVVDETNNPDDLHFYWRGAAYDDDFSLQDRLQRLYRDGMERFLNETVTYIENDEIEKAFRWYKKDPDATMKTVMGYFRALKFFSDNDFSFISVHNEQLFKENAIILRKVLLMLENIKLKSTGKDTEPNQFLGDLFEGFLTKGVKQSEGQYFTPMPIVRFIVSSLPLEQIIGHSEEIPSCIDYACGAGHFLTEYAVRIREFVEKYRPGADIHEYYKHITGIEKEYRLSKVSKVSAFMYGHDETNIVYADALKGNDSLKPGSYDVLIANPPYSVTGFLETLGESDRMAYTLYDNVSNVGKNNAIETFFMERAAQLMKAGGVAGIILPVSVLNKGGIYAHARQIILEAFDIVALVEFGSGTFGKTGTNTVVLFLRRKETNTPVADHYRNRVKTWFASGDNAEDIYEDEEMLTAYCAHCGYDVSDYKAFLKSGYLDERLAQTEVFSNYNESFDSTSKTAMKGVCDKAKDIRSKFIARSKTKTFKMLSETHKAHEKSKAIYSFIREIEKEKVYLFLLAHTVEQPVLLVKSPSKTEEIKKFLGYEWSDSKGNEGIQYLHIKNKSKSEDDGNAADDDTMQQIRGINGIETPLFCPSNLSASDKINTLIRRNFMGEAVAVPAELSEYVSQAMLTDMIDFKRTAFDKAIKTSVKIQRATANGTKIGELCDINKETFNPSETPEQEYKYIDIDAVENGTGIFHLDKAMRGKELPSRARRIASAGSTLISTVRPYLKGFAYLEQNIPNSIVSTGFAVLKSKDETKLLNKIIYLAFMYDSSLMQQMVDAMPKGSYPSINKSDIENLVIPLPPLSVQQQIVSECETIDSEVNEAQTAISEAQAEIERLTVGANGENKLLKDIAPLRTERIAYAVISPETYVSTDNLLQDCQGKALYKGEPNITSVIAYRRGDLLLSNIRPYLRKLWLADCDGGCSPDVLVLRPSNEVLPQYLYNALRRQQFFDYIMTDVKGMKMPRGKKEVIEKYSVPIPPLEVQREVVARISEHECEIAAAKQTIAAAPAKKQTVLDKYLK